MKAMKYIEPTLALIYCMLEKTLTSLKKGTLINNINNFVCAIYMLLLIVVNHRYQSN